MNISTLYRQLLDVLQTNQVAALVSHYEGVAAVDGNLLGTSLTDMTAAGTAGSKEVIALNDEQNWQRVERLMTDPKALINGPVCALQGADSSLTIVERYTARPRLIILGAGHIAVTLAHMASLLDFEVVVFDDRPSFANAQRFPQAKTVICDSFTRLFERVQVRSTDYVVIITRGHKHDADCLRGILSGAEPMYTGMIGSRRRVAIVMDQLREEAYESARIKRICSPIGLRIGALTPAEISISILAEIVSARRLGDKAQTLSSCDLDVVEALAEDVAAEDGARRSGGSGVVGASGAAEVTSDVAAGDSGRIVGTADRSMDALITIYATDGSVPADCGAKLAMTYDGHILGTIGGGCSESDAMQVARELINKGEPGAWCTHTIDMTDSAEDDGMVCGGQMHVIIEKL